jgi:hypothetical protein
VASQGLNHDINSRDCKCDRGRAVSCQTATALDEPLHRNIAMISCVDRLSSLGEIIQPEKVSCRRRLRDTTKQVSARLMHAARHHEEAAEHHEAGRHETAAHHAHISGGPHRSCQRPRRRGSEGPRRGARSPRWRAPPCFRRSAIGQNIAPAIQVGHSGIAPLQPVFVCSRQVIAVIPRAATALCFSLQEAGALGRSSGSEFREPRKPQWAGPQR